MGLSGQERVARETPQLEARTGDKLMYGILERAQETWTRVGLGPRFAIERVKIGNSRPKVARACALLDLLILFDPSPTAHARFVPYVSRILAPTTMELVAITLAKILLLTTATIRHSSK